MVVNDQNDKHFMPKNIIQGNRKTFGNSINFVLTQWVKLNHVIRLIIKFTH